MGENNQKIEHSSANNSQVDQRNREYPTNDPAMQKEMLSRLKKIEGQVRGVQKMVQEYRSCGDIVIQLAAIKAAVNRVGVTVLACHLADKLKDEPEENNDIKAVINEFMGLFKKFS